MFFENVKEFNLEKHFDPRHPDVRVRIKDLFERTKETIAREKHINLEVVLLIGCLEEENAAVNLGIGKREDLAKCLGLTANMYWKRAQAARVLMRFPEFIDLVRDGKTHISHLSILSPKITEANSEIFFEEVSGKSEREVRELVSSVGYDGSRSEIEPTVDLKLSLTKSQLELLDRAKEVLSETGYVPSDEEVLVKALGDLLERRDPVRKAERAAARRERKQNLTSAQKEHVPTGPSELKKRRLPIPAQTTHGVYLRDQGRCNYIDQVGNQCQARHTLQVDHIVPVALGGGNELSNLRLLCREHNLMEGERILGKDVMESWKESS